MTYHEAVKVLESSGVKNICIECETWILVRGVQDIAPVFRIWDGSDHREGNSLEEAVAKFNMVHNPPKSNFATATDVGSYFVEVATALKK